MNHKLFLLLFSALAGVYAFAGEIDFSRGPKNYWAAGGTASVTDGMLKLTWDPAKRKFMEFAFPMTPRIGNFETLTLKVDLKRTPKSTLNGLSIRLLDKNGEIFQYYKPVAAGTTQLVFKVNALDPKPNGSWKNSPKAVSDKKLDMPVSLVGIAIYAPANSKPGEVLITSIRYDKYPADSNLEKAKEK